ncbi:MAG: InlB B-repeat-containing protein, partial [Clostridia bacterium]|nr:InlB B-repeat-containing protein [Clostridia bacterium]
SATGKHDARKRAYVPVYPGVAPATHPDIADCKTMASQMDAGNLDTFLYDDMYHEFIIGEPHTVSFKVDGVDFADPASYLSGAKITAPEKEPSKEGFEFKGWAVEGTTDAVDFATYTMGDEDVTFVAIFKEIVKYTATFMVEGEVYGDVNSYLEGEAIVAPATDPTREGFIFDGWDPEVGVMGAEDIVFTAKWKEKSSVYFMDGEKQIDVKKGEAGETVAQPEDPSKEGYTFNGWVDADGAAVTFPVTLTEDAIYIYADWTAIKYEVSFDDDGNVTGGEFDFGTTVTLPTPAARKGHTFKGWFDEEGNEFTDESTVPVGGVKLTAVFEKNTYNAIFDADAGAFANGEKTVTVPTLYGEQIIAPADPVKEGYKFAGWDYEVGTMGDADFTFTAVFEIQEYNVTWNFDNGEDALVLPVLYNNPVIAPETPTKEGHTFAGWDADIPANMPAKDLEFTATWTVNDYTVTWINDGVETTETVKYRAEVNGEELTAVGREFLGWKMDGATDYVEFPFTMPASDVTFVAEWNYIWYDVTWDVDGVQTKDEYHYNDKIEAPADPVKEGYTFKGWTPEVPATMPAEDLTFVAIFEINSYDVTWDFDNGEDAQVDKVVYGDAIATPADPVKVGHSFNGWSPEVPDAMPAEDLSFVATWVKNIYNAIFDANGGKFADGTDSVTLRTEFEAAVATPDAPVKDGSTFVAWTPAVAETMPAEDVTYTAVWAEGEGIPYLVETYTMDENGNYELTDAAGYVVETAQTVNAEPKAEEGFYVDEELSVLSADAAEDKVAVLKIYYARNQYSIVFDANGGLIDGVATQTDATYYHGNAVATPSEPVKVGHTFNGWDPIFEAIAKADVKYIAQWLVNKYTITFNTNGGSEIAPITQDFGSAIATPADPVREGYTFTGWDGEIPATMPAEDLTFNASWEINSYTVTWDVDGEITTETYEYGAEIVIPADPDKDGFVFDGWTPEVPATMPAEDLTFVATWIEDSECEHQWKTVTVDADCTEAGQTYDVCELCGEKTKVTVIPAKGHVEGEWVIVTEATYEADGKAEKRCTVCDEVIDTAVISKLLLPSIEITDEDGNKLAADFEIRYGESVTLTVSDDLLPEGAYVEWVVEGEGVEYTVSEDGLSITLTSVESGDIKVKAVVVNADGEPILDEFGCENSAEINVKSDACFFWKLVHFIKSIFNFSIFKYIFGLIC